jgi:hypothetical protein
MRYVILLLSLFACVAAQAATLPVYPNGAATIAVPANQYVSVFTVGGGIASVYQQVGGPGNNSVVRYTEITGSPVSNSEYVFGPFTTATNVRILAGADLVWYSVSALGAATPVVRPGPVAARDQQSPATYNTTGTLLSTDLLNGIITSVHVDGSTITLTLPTGTLLDAAAGLAVNQGFEWTSINNSLAAADTVTIAAGSGHTIVGTSVVPSLHASTGALYGNAIRFFSRKTAANTFVTYRIQ